MEKTVLLKVSTDTLSRESRATSKGVVSLGSGRSLRPSETERRVSSDQREKMSVWVHQTGDHVASRGLLPPDCLATFRRKVRWALREGWFATEPEETSVSSRGSRSVPWIRQELCVSKEYPDAKFILYSSVRDDLSSGVSVRVGTHPRTDDNRHAADPMRAGEARRRGMLTL